MLPKSLLRTSTSPLAVIRSRRIHDIRVLTSLPAGKMVPIRAIPLLREDQLDSCVMRLSFEMMETVEILMNAVNVNVKAYLVPHLAFERFSGMDELNRSFSGVPNEPGGGVTPYFTISPGVANGVNKVHKYLGVHEVVGQDINQGFVEAYNAIWNFRAKNRSPDITLRTETDATLAPAFWQHEQFAHIVPDFDQAAIDGEIALNVIGGQLPVKSSGDMKFKLGATNDRTIAVLAADRHVRMNGPALAADANLQFDTISNVFAELQNDGITVSLSNIELARKTQAFAKLRTQYNGHDDDYIIDLLMDGLSIPEQAFRQPILLAEKSTVFGMSKRYASDSGNLTESVVNGMTAIDLRLRCPQVPMGGIVMIVAEITPEQLFERQADPYLHTTTADALPHYLRDTLDPEKVSVVKNSYVDVRHGTPDGTFGYAPLNHEWNHTCPGIGGKFFRPDANTSFDEARQRIWSVETLNPSLSADFYLCNAMHTKPFVVTNEDPFEVVARGMATISGNTVFGQTLIEATDDYEKVLAEADTDRIVKG